MVQYLNPIADLLVGAWTTDTAATTNLYRSLADPVAEDTTYIKSDEAPAASVYVVGLGSATDPVSSTGHTFTWRWRNLETDADLAAVVQLRQGYSNESSQGTLIATRSYSDVPASFTTVTETLSAGEANTISNYTALSLRFVMTQT